MFTWPVTAAPIILVTRTPAGLDRYGNNSYAETRTTVYGCIILPTFIDKDIYAPQGDVASGRFKMLAPPTVNLNAVDGVETLSGQTFEIEGQVKLWPDFAGNIHHVEVYMRETSIVGNRNVAPT